MDRGASWAAVHRVLESRTQLKWLALMHTYLYYPVWMQNISDTSLGRDREVCIFQINVILCTWGISIYFIKSTSSGIASAIEPITLWSWNTSLPYSHTHSFLMGPLKMDNIGTISPTFFSSFRIMVRARKDSLESILRKFKKFCLLGL